MFDIIPQTFSLGYDDLGFNDILFPKKKIPNKI